jgi:hypothetical protein
MATTEPTEDTFHTYLHRPEERAGPISRVEKFYEFCHSASLNSLLSDTDADVSRPLNIVSHSNCFRHGVCCSSESRGPVNARDIYHELIEAGSSWFPLPFTQNHECIIKIMRAEIVMQGCQNSGDESCKASGPTIEEIRQRLM